MQPKVSVVVPIYGVEKYLNQCVDSILAQTLTDIEVILVDDGSKDRCPQIVDEYAKKDKRVVAIHQPNGGYGRAVNHGIEVATGEYIGIIESDDWIEPTMYEKLYNKIIKYEADVCRCGFSVYDSFKTGEQGQDYVWDEVNEMFRDMPDEVFCPRDYKRIFMYHSAIWCYLYKSELIKNIPIIENARSYQDFPFMFEVLAVVNKMIIVKEVLHHYRMEAAQGSSSTTKSEKAMQMMEMTNFTLINLMKKNLFEGIEKEFYQHSLLANLFFYNNTPRDFQLEYATRILEFEKNIPSQILDDLPEHIKNWLNNITLLLTEKNCKLDADDIYVSFSSDDNYCDIMGIALQSMIDHMNPKLNYHVYILDDNISVDKKSLIYRMGMLFENLFIHFIDVHECKEKIENVFVDRYLSIATYYRFFLPELLPDIDKILYLDSDIIINEDIANLYHIDIAQNVIGGCLDFAVRDCNAEIFEKCHKILSSLDYKDFSNYINAGVILFNLKKMRELNITQTLLTTALSTSFVFHDQDVINLVCEGDIKILDGKWNFVTHLSLEIYPYVVQQNAYTHIATNNIGIIHYAGSSKPWMNLKGLLYGNWWNVASRSLFFNECMLRLKCNESPLPVQKPICLHGLEKLLCIHNEYGHKVVRFFTFKVFSKRIKKRVI